MNGSLPKSSREDAIASIPGFGPLGDLTLASFLSVLINALTRGRWDRWRREKHVLRVLRGLSRQHVWDVSKDTRQWTITEAIKREHDTDATLATALMRGWIEPLPHNGPWQDLDYYLIPRILSGRTETSNCIG